MRKTAEKLFIAIVALLPVAVLGTKSLAMPRNLAAKTSKSKKNSKSTQKSKDVDDGQCDERTLLLEADGEEVRQRIIDQAFQELEGAEFFDEAFVEKSILGPYEAFGFEVPGFSYDDVSSSKAFLENEIAMAVSILGEEDITSSFVEPFNAILDPTTDKEIRKEKMKKMIEIFVNEAIKDVDPYGLNSSSEISVQTTAMQMEELRAESGLSNACTNSIISYLSELVFLALTFFKIPGQIANFMGGGVADILIIRFGFAHFKKFFKAIFSQPPNIMTMAWGFGAFFVDIISNVGISTIWGMVTNQLNWWQVASYASLILSQIAIAVAGSAAVATIYLINMSTAFFQVAMSVGNSVGKCPCLD